jgi:hypothetical protein
MALKNNKQEELPFPVEVVTEEEMTDDQEVTSTEIVVSETETQLADYEILNPELPMATKIGPAVQVAETLKKVIEAQGLVKTGLNKKAPEEKYVLTGGWAMLNTFMGLTPVTKVVGEIRNDKGKIRGYKAQCTLLRNPEYKNGDIVGGTVVSHAEASATVEGFQKETSTMMSMAETRAFNKATRQELGWIMEMAGFQGTPAEEMPTFRGK